MQPAIESFEDKRNVTASKAMHTIVTCKSSLRSALYWVTFSLKFVSKKMAYNVKVFMKLWHLKNVSFN